MKWPDELETGYPACGPAHGCFDSFHAVELHPDYLAKLRTLRKLNFTARGGNILNLNLVTVLRATTELDPGADRDSRGLATGRIMRIYILATG